MSVECKWCDEGVTGAPHEDGCGRELGGGSEPIMPVCGWWQPHKAHQVDDLVNARKADCRGCSVSSAEFFRRA